MVVLLCFSALISGAEVAFFSLTPSELDPPDDDPNARGVRTVRRLLADPKKLLATILVANNLINIAIVLLFAGIGERLLGDIQIDFYGINLRFIIEVVVVTFLILLFGEILPKVYASRNSVKFSAFMSGPISVLDKLFTPISLPMKTGTVAIENRFGRRKSSISIDQLSQALELTDHGETTLEEQKILQGIVTFGNTDTKQVMRPRMEIFALNEEMGYQEVISAIVENGYSRIPVYKDSIDNITGILYAKDLIPHLEKKKFY